MFNFNHTQKVHEKDFPLLLDATTTVNQMIFQSEQKVGIAVGMAKKENGFVNALIWYNSMEHVCSLFYFFGAKVAEAEKEKGGVK